MYWALRVMLKRRVFKTNFLTNVITSGDLEVCLLTMCTVLIDVKQYSKVGQ